MMEFTITEQKLISQFCPHHEYGRPAAIALRIIIISHMKKKNVDAKVNLNSA